MVHLVWIQATRNTVLISLTASSGVARLTVEPLGEGRRGVAATNTGDILNGTEKPWGVGVEYTACQGDGVTFGWYSSTAIYLDVEWVLV